MYVFIFLNTQQAASCDWFENKLADHYDEQEPPSLVTVSLNFNHLYLINYINKLLTNKI